MVAVRGRISEGAKEVPVIHNGCPLRGFVRSGVGVTVCRPSLRSGIHHRPRL
ncbi:hypothetical protein FRUB_05514 [Fimbriiglobus ruber]|uniref:Uncharacterized protein n=1 Tax=Fimbriiglobus ruber TaxID=1908690 RepID=A0A225DWA1_9BACT|nr:hypothetical protein FRUB_05514 [Fimbriiglobus ruber]